jgi:hypothetical protein
MYMRLHSMVIWHVWHNWSAPLQKAFTALILAAQKGHADCVRLLTEAGADKNAKDKQDCLTALHCAVQLDKADCVRVLLEAGADKDVKCKVRGDGVGRTCEFRLLYLWQFDISPFAFDGLSAWCGTFCSYTLRKNSRR